MLFGVYAGAMRGMNTDATVVIGDGPLRRSPLGVAHVVRDRDARQVLDAPRAASCGPAPSCSSTTRPSRPRSTPTRTTWCAYPRPTSPTELGNELGASMVMAGAYVGITGLVSLERPLEAMRQSIPPYRTQHIAANEVAITAGFERANRLAAPAWPETMVAT